MRWMKLTLVVLVAVAALVTAASAAVWVPGEKAVPDAAWSLWHNTAADCDTGGTILFNTGTKDTVAFGFVSDQVWGTTSGADCTIERYMDPTFALTSDRWASPYAAAADTLRMGPRIGEPRMTSFAWPITAPGEFRFKKRWTGFIVSGVTGAGTLTWGADGRER